MMTVDWGAFGVGMLTGTMGSLLFFAGLALGMRLALRRARQIGVLLVSAAVRIAMLLALGALMLPHGVAAIAGFALAFFVVRLVVITMARPSAANQRPGREVDPWN